LGGGSRLQGLRRLGGVPEGADRDRMDLDHSDCDSFSEKENLRQMALGYTLPTDIGIRDGFGQRWSLGGLRKPLSLLK